MYVENPHRLRALAIEAKRPQRLALEGGCAEVDPRVEQKIDLEPAKEHDLPLIGRLHQKRAEFGHWPAKGLRRRLADDDHDRYPADIIVGHVVIEHVAKFPA